MTVPKDEPRQCWQTAVGMFVLGVTLGTLALILMEHFVTKPTPNAMMLPNGKHVTEFELRSANGDFRAVLQNDCNLVVNDVIRSRPIWSTDSVNHNVGCYLEQEDHHIILYSVYETVLYEFPSRGNTLYLDDYGKLHVLGDVVRATVSSPPSPPPPPPPTDLLKPYYHDSHQCIILRKPGGAYGTFVLTMGDYTATYQPDNNLVIYKGGNDVIWASHTVGTFQGLRRADGHWFIGNHQIWKAPVPVDFNTLCLTEHGQLKRTYVGGFRDEL